jgi:DNA-binding transcriptional ArsR family regulator
MDIFIALAEPTRRNIIELLASYGQLSASEICEKFTVTASAISQHLKVLKEANLVKVEKQAQQRIYTINTDSMVELEEWAKKTRQIYEARFDRLEKLLEREKLKMKN